MENGSPSRRSWADEADEELSSPQSLGAGQRGLFPHQFLGGGSGGRVCFSDSELYSNSESPSPLPPGKGKAVAEGHGSGTTTVDAAAAAVPELPRSMFEVGPSSFLTKTYDFVDDPDTDTVVSWGSAGESFIVHDPHAFAEILWNNLEHCNFSRFVGQLITYGFRNVDLHRWEFANEGFRRGQRELLKTIKRRLSLTGFTSELRQLQDENLFLLARSVKSMQELQEPQASEECVYHFNPLPAPPLAFYDGLLELAIRDQNQNHSTVSMDYLCRSSSTTLSNALCVPPAQRRQQQPLALISADSWESSGSYYGCPELASHSNVYTIVTSTGGQSLGNLLAADGSGGPGHLESHGSRRISRWGAAGASTSTGCQSLGNLLAADGGGPGHLGSHGSSHISRWGGRRILTIAEYGTTATGGGEADLEAGGEQADGGAATAQQLSVNAPISGNRQARAVSAKRPPSRTFSPCHGDPGYTPTSDVNSFATTAGASTSAGGGQSLGMAANGGGGLGAQTRRSGTTATATGGTEADLEAGLGGDAPAQQRPVHEEKASQLLIQIYAALVATSFVSFNVFKDAPKHVKIIILGGQVIIMAIAFAGILSSKLAHRWLAIWLISCLAVALLTFSVASS